MGVKNTHRRRFSRIPDDVTATSLLVKVRDKEFPKLGKIGALGETAGLQQLESSGDSTPGFSETKGYFGYID